jgi:broad-specificity NMP kinase
MPLLYVTGIPGTGKSAVLRELRARGFEAQGVDEDGFADWVHRETGQIEEFPRGDASAEIHTWYAKHAWVLSANRIAGLKRESDGARRSVFLCGVAEGEPEVWHYFDRVIALVAPADVLYRRLATREGNNFGKSPLELAEIMKWYATSEASYRRAGAIVVDATQSIRAVANEVVRHAFGGETVGIRAAASLPLSTARTTGR